MMAILRQQKVDYVLMDPKDISKSVNKEENNLKEMDRVAHSLIILHLADSVIRQMCSETTTAKLWKRGKADFHTRDLAVKSS